MPRGYRPTAVTTSETLIANAIKPPHRAGIQRHENLLSIWMTSVRYPGGEEGVRIGWICVLVEEGLLVALGFGEGFSELENVRRHMEDEPEQLWETPLDVLREMVGEVFDSYDEAVENLDGRLHRQKGRSSTAIQASPAGYTPLPAWWSSYTRR